MHLLNEVQGKAVLGKFLGEFLAAGNSAKVVSYCDSIALTLGKYIDLPAFERNPHVNLRAAISHLRG